VGSRDAAANPQGAAPPSVLSDVLGELRRVHGDLTFRVLGTAALVTESGQAGRVGGMPLNVEQQAFVQGERLSAKIDLEVTGIGSPDADIALLPVGSLSIHTSLRRGEFVVLGEGELQEILGGGVQRLVFYIVHWPEE
jgi:hypothetical protein